MYFTCESRSYLTQGEIEEIVFGWVKRAAEEDRFIRQDPKVPGYDLHHWCVNKIWDHLVLSIRKEAVNKRDELFSKYSSPCIIQPAKFPIFVPKEYGKIIGVEDPGLIEYAGKKMDEDLLCKLERRYENIIYFCGRKIRHPMTPEEAHRQHLIHELDRMEVERARAPEDKALGGLRVVVGDMLDILHIGRFP